MRTLFYLLLLLVLGCALLTIFWRPEPFFRQELPQAEPKDSLYAVDLSNRLAYLGLEGKDCYVRIHKSAYQLSFIADSIVVKHYAVVFGENPIDDKLRQGDKCTPEGTFHIRGMREHPKWQKFIWIDYPTADSWKKHRQAIAEGQIPASSNIGGEIGIHGVPYGQDYAIPNRFNWTLGCISMQNKDVNELYPFLSVGTKVAIRH